jgi:glyoxylase-like metal-dependent hydrolase (beta-lactamase superfamily II)
MGGDGGPELLLIPLFGHTRGHCGVAVRDADGWQLHCGDAYFFHGEMSVQAPSCTPGLSAFQELVAVDRAARRRNRDRLLELARSRPDRALRMFCAHDPTELARMQRPTAEVAGASA